MNNGKGKTLVFFTPKDFAYNAKGYGVSWENYTASVANKILQDNSELIDDNGEPKLLVDMERES